MARRRVAGIVRLGVIGLVAKVAGMDVVVVGAIGIVEAVRRCQLARRARWKRLGALLRAAMLPWRMRRWMRHRVLGKKMRLVRVLLKRMVSAGGVDVADGGGDVGLLARDRVSRRLGMRQMNLA
jgi:hypothetical protein